ncbi:hypothetical protein [Bacillus cytotoxicus]|uniref:hypothetical protein n=1 Tax=Bacillus cytotoxicus TaxID=580165 RepID=UPI00244B238A|nr:hypothetical protein [Bacillus cytotoxicus]MDH2890277.1 hypothetical protein [Bacillus cytotoxicus]
MILTEEKLISKIMDFVCYEKNYFYVLAKVYNVGDFELFYMDRWIDWEFKENGSEPILTTNNAFKQNLIKRNILVAHTAKFNDIYSELINETSLGNKINMVVEMDHIDGTRYYTNTLIEKVTSTKVLYTKINENMQKINVGMSREDFVERLPKELELEYEVIRYDEDLHRQLNISDSELCNKILKEWMDFSIVDEQLYMRGQLVKYNIYAFESMINYLQNEKDNILKNINHEKNIQNRLGKQIENKILPLIVLYEYFIEKQMVKDNNISVTLRKSINQLKVMLGLIVELSDENYYEHYVATFKNIAQQIQDLQAGIYNVILDLLTTNNKGV